jgi:hypothetical protein
MSAAGEAQPSRDPKGPAPRDCGEADAPWLPWRRWAKEADA